MIAVDLAEGKLYDDRAIKDQISGEQDYAAMIGEFLTMDQLPAPSEEEALVRMPRAEMLRRQVAAGQTMEDMELILSPMAEGARKPSARWATTRRWRSSPTSRA